MITSLQTRYRTHTDSPESSVATAPSPGVSRMERECMGGTEGKRTEDEGRKKKSKERQDEQSMMLDRDTAAVHRPVTVRTVLRLDCLLP